jgi:hypothetical protein
MQRGWRADIDDVDLLVGQQTLEIAMRSADPMLLAKSSTWSPRAATAVTCASSP